MRIPATKPIEKVILGSRAEITILTGNHDYSTILGNLQGNPNKNKKNKPAHAKN